MKSPYNTSKTPGGSWTRPARGTCFAVSKIIRRYTYPALPPGRAGTPRSSGWGLDVESLFNVATDDLRDGEAIFASMVRVHEPSGFFEVLEGDFVRQHREELAAADPSPGRERQRGQNNDAGRSRSPRQGCGEMPGLPDIPDVFLGGGRNRGRHRCGRRQSGVAGPGVGRRGGGGAGAVPGVAVWSAEALRAPSSRLRSTRRCGTVGE